MRFAYELLAQFLQVIDETQHETGCRRNGTTRLGSDVIPISRLAAQESNDCPFPGQFTTTFVEPPASYKSDIGAQEEVR
jgi:hypothetical protein